MAATYTTLQLNGKAYRLRYDGNALCELEDRLQLATIVELPKIRLSLRNVRTLLWAGLLHDGETRSERDVFAMVDTTNLSAVTEAVGEALAQAFAPPVEKPDEGNPRKAVRRSGARPTGKPADGST